MKEMTISEIADSVHELAWKKGWHDVEETEDHFVERMCNNLHDEVSELHEAWRTNVLRKHCGKYGCNLTCLEEELADIIIRVLDNSLKLGVDIEHAIRVKHAYNKKRPMRHGGKRS